MEIINAPSPVKTSRNNDNLYLEGSYLIPLFLPRLPATTFQLFANPSCPSQPGKATKYIHFILNQRTIPLHRSFPECEERDDGWCDLDTFLEVQSKSLELSQYDWACNGDYPAVPYGNITDGVPVQGPS